MSVLDLNEDNLSATLQGHPLVVLDFWASWCEPCRAEMPSLELAAQRHERDGLSILAVNFRETDQALNRFLTFFPLSLPVLRDRATPSPRTQLVSQSINGSFAYREGDWKLALCRGSGGWSAPKPGSAEEAKLPEFQLYDLAQDLGVFGKPEQARVLDEKRDLILAAAKKHGKTTAMLVNSFEQMQQWRNAGALLLAYSSDAEILHQGFSAAMKRITRR